MGTIDVKKIVAKALEEQGCKLEENDGIIKVSTPDGRLWDFTTPTDITPQPVGEPDAAAA